VSGRGRVRHEAGEALGAIGTPECVAALAAGAADARPVVAQTCQLALQRVQHHAVTAREDGGAAAAGAAVRPVDRT
jgi:deoxyhypusine monooxygenase